MFGRDDHGLGHASTCGRGGAAQAEGGFRSYASADRRGVAGAWGKALVLRRPWPDHYRFGREGSLPVL